MFKIIIKSQIHGERWLEKQTQAEVDDYIHWCTDSKHWGLPQWIENVPEQVEIVIQEGGVQVQNIIPGYQIVHPAEYTIEVEDITQETEQAKINKEALEFLASSDWYLIREIETGVKMPEEIRLERQKSRESIVH